MLHSRSPVFAEALSPTVLLRFVGTLNAWTAAGLSALNITLDGFVLKHKSRQSIDWPETDDPAIKKEVWQYILPATPAIILGAFHGQIALFLVGIFGNTVTIGQVAALSRFALLFNVMMTFNMVIVEPYVARLPRGRLLGTYFKLIAIALVGCAVVTLIAFGAPGIFLWLLGPQYQGLRSLIGWVFLTACINYTAGLIWIMNRSRRWLFLRGTIAEISLQGYGPNRVSVCVWRPKHKRCGDVQLRIQFLLSGRSFLYCNPWLQKRRHRRRFGRRTSRDFIALVPGSVSEFLRNTRLDTNPYPLLYSLLFMLSH